MRLLHERFHEVLPRLTAENYRVTSPSTPSYNCIAWAVGVDDVWWWPSPTRFWPETAPREETVSAFLAAFASARYAVCADGEWEPGIEKIALYVANDRPTHAARQSSNGKWTSKLGQEVDIEHDTPETVGGGIYGEATVFVSRRAESQATAR